MTALALTLLSFAAAAFLYCVLRGPTVPDRAVALDGFLSVVVSGIIVAAVRIGSDILLSSILIVALAGFVGTTAIARYVERRGG